MNDEVCEVCGQDLVYDPIEEEYICEDCYMFFLVNQKSRGAGTYERAISYGKRPLSDNEIRQRALNGSVAYRNRRLERTPGWACIDAISVIYADSRWLTKVTGIKFSVDHEYPMFGELISGLHVENNLRIITGRANSKKHNKFAIQ